MTKIRIAQQNVDTFSLVSPRVHYILLTFRWEWLPRHCDHCWIIILPKKMLVCTFKKKKNASKFERKSHSFTFRFRSSAIPFKNPRFGNGQSAAAAASHRGLTVLNRPVFGMFSGVPSGNLT